MTTMEVLAVLGDAGIIVVAGVLWWHLSKCDKRATEVTKRRRDQWKEVSWLGRCMERVATKLDITLPDKEK